MSHQHMEMLFGQWLCIRSENAFISNLQGHWIQNKSQIWNSSLHSTESLLWSAEVSWGQRISALHSTYRFRVASLGTVINILLEKAFCKAVRWLVWKQGISVISVPTFWVMAMSVYGHCNSIYYASHFQNRWPYSGQFPLFTIHLACTLDSRPFI